MAFYAEREFLVGVVFQHKCIHEHTRAGKGGRDRGAIEVRSITDSMLEKRNMLIYVYGVNMVDLEQASYNILKYCVK